MSIRYYYQAAKTRAFYQSTEGLANNPPNSHLLGELVKWCQNSLFRCHNNHSSQLRNSSVWTWTLTWTDAPEPLLTLKMVASMIQYNLSYIILAGTGSWLLMDIQRDSDTACSPSNKYVSQPRQLSELICDLHIGSVTLPGMTNTLSCALMCSQKYDTQFHSTAAPVIRDPSFFCTGHHWSQILQTPAGIPSWGQILLWHSPDIVAYWYTLHIIIGTPGGFQRLKYICWRIQNDGKAMEAITASKKTLSVFPRVWHWIWGITECHEMKNLLRPTLSTAQFHINQQDVFQIFHACWQREDNPLKVYFTKLCNCDI